MMAFAVGSVCFVLFFFFFKQRTAYEMRISDWSSDVCSSDLPECESRGATVSARCRPASGSRQVLDLISERNPLLPTAVLVERGQGLIGSQADRKSVV